MQEMNRELKKLMGAFKTAQNQVQASLKSGNLVSNVRKYAEGKGREAKKIFSSDVAKLKSFVEKEIKEVEKIQKQLPQEVQKLRKFVDSQRREFERLLVSIRDGKAQELKAKVKAKARSVRSKKNSGARKNGSSSS